MRRVAAILAVVGMLVALGVAEAGARLAVIQLERRPAEEIIPILAPLLDPTDRISGQGFQLFVDAAPENIARIREIVGHLDQAARQLAVTVVQGEHALETLNALAVSGRVSIGDHVAVGVGDEEHRSDDDALRVDARHHRQSRRLSGMQRVLVQDGATATIFVALSAPVVAGSPRHRGVAYHEVVAYRQLVTGMQVTPRVSGQQVTLTIDARREQPSSDGSAEVRTQQIQTRVQGRLNEWIDLGAILSAASRTESGIGHGAAAQESGRHHVFLRVEPVE